jgi:pSer/pThr/pTyr-binding forkhead associated (FHA) protein
MYLKVNNADKDLYYKFKDGQTVTIGRSVKSDICLIAEGVSRNHLEILSGNGEYFVKDLGATNGSFINEEKLASNQKIPFNTFFPVQLGFHAKVFLVDESEDTKALDKLVEETRQFLAD